MSFTPPSKQGILSKLPVTEQEFLINQADLILQKSSGTLEDLFKNVAAVFSEKEYGWEEAVRENKWYRYPSEVQHQRFCSEEALKNYFLLRVLGLPVEYCLLENYQGTSMAHEVVLVQTENSPYLIDWQNVCPVTVEQDAFIKPNNEKIPFKKIHRLPEEEVLDRVLSLRNGERFLAAIECEQILFRKETEEGQLQGSVRYDSELKILDFTFVFLRYTGGLQLYLRHSTGVDEEDKIYDCQEFGICEVQHAESVEEFPIIIFNYGECVRDIQTCPFFNDLLPQQQRSICMETMYDNLSSNQDAAEGKFVGCEAERQETLFLWKEAIKDISFPQDLKEIIQRYLNIYDLLKEKNSHSAERFLDFQISKMAFDQLFPTNEDLHNNYWSQYETNPLETSLLYTCSAMRDLGKAFSSTKTLETSNILTQLMCSKTGINFKPCTFSKLFDIVENFSTMTRQDFYR